MYYSLPDVITSSLKLAWKHKILWVLALMLSVGAGYGGSNRASSFSDSYKDSTKQESMNQKVISTQNRNRNVLGLTTTSIENYGLVMETTPFDFAEPYKGSRETVTITSAVPTDSFTPFEILKNFSKTSGVALWAFTIIPLSLLVFMVFSFLISTFIRSWAAGAFFNGIDDAIESRDFDLHSLGLNGRLSFKSVFIYRLFRSFFVLVFLLLLIFCTFLLLNAFNSDNALVSTTILVLFLFFSLLIPNILLAIIEPFVIRFVSIKKMLLLDSIKAGWKVFSTNFIKYLLLSVSNCFVVGIFSFGIVLILSSLLFALIPGINLIENAGPILVGVLFVFMIPLFFSGFAAMIAVGAYISTYKEFTYGWFFKYASQESDLKIKEAPTNINRGVKQIDNGDTNV